MASKGPASLCLPFSPCLMPFFSTFGLHCFSLSPEDILSYPRAFAHAVPSAWNILFSPYQSHFFLERCCSCHTSPSLSSSSAFCLSSYHLLGFKLSCLVVYLALSVPSFPHCKLWGPEHRLIHSFHPSDSGDRKCGHLLTLRTFSVNTSFSVKPSAPWESWGNLLVNSYSRLKIARKSNNHVVIYLSPPPDHGEQAPRTQNYFLLIFKPSVSSTVPES